jgi:amphi-Trp domain-containing protein
VVTVPSRFQGRARRDAAAFYLSQLAQGILAGELSILAGHETVTVQPSDVLLLDIAISQTSRGHQVSVRVRWPRRSDRNPAITRGQPRGTEPDPSRRGGHLEFTRPSSERNPGA